MPQPQLEMSWGLLKRISSPVTLTVVNSSRWLGSLLTCYLWYDRFCRTVSVVLYAGLWHVEMWMYQWFAEMLTAYVLSRWQETQSSLRLSSGSCCAVVYLCSTPPAPQNCKLIQTRTSKREPSLPHSVGDDWLLACVTSSFNQLVAAQNNILLSSLHENVIGVLH